MCSEEATNPLSPLPSWERMANVCEPGGQGPLTPGPSPQAGGERTAARMAVTALRTVCYNGTQDQSEFHNARQ
jgi:hypothetical protein